MPDFEIISLPYRQLPPATAARYRVYRDSKDFTVVDAPNAHEALGVSGIQKPYRIEREASILHGIIDLEKVCAPAAPKAAKQEAPAAPTVAVEPGTALTGDQVSKLLQEQLSQPSAAS